jgi:glycosyltransferase involved in cell wall biosynthesis
MERISAVILTFNEQRNIARCIESVLPVADEIVVVDSFSTDATEAICRKYGVRFIQHAFEGYIEQKNYATSLASNEIILSLDADEALSDELIQSIKEVKKKRLCDGYSMNRLTNYCGKWIHHSGWYPDSKLRLLDRREGKWGGTNPHDKFEMNEKSTVCKINGDLFHYSYYTFEEHRSQIIKFADISAKALHQKGVRSGPGKIIYKPIARFLRTYIVKAGILDGKEGWTIARMTAWASYLRYTQLYKIQKQA